MLARIARLAARRPWRIALVALVGFLASVPLGTGLTGNLSAGGFDDPGQETARAAALLERAGGASPVPSVIALVRPGGEVRGPAGRAAVGRVARRLRADPSVAVVLAPQSLGGRDLVSRDGRSAYVVASFRPGSDDAAEEAARRVRRGLEGTPGVTLGGVAVANEEIGAIIADDLTRAEIVAFPLLLLLSLWVFRGLVAALLPPLVGAVTIFAGYVVLGLLAEVTTISVFALNLVTGLSLGLAIDYSLLIVSRYREEIARGGAGAPALVRTLTTAGRSVLFSAVTVAAALAGLMVFPQRFLFSMGAGGVIVAALAALVALVVLPAVLALLGPRVNALAPAAWRRRTEAADRPETGGAWYRLSRVVMRRPLPIALLAAGLMIALSLPAFGARFTSVDATVLPAGAEAREVQEALRADFPKDRSSPVYVVLTAPPGPESARVLAAHAADLARLPGARSAGPPIPVGPGAWRIDVVSTEAPLSDRTADLVRAARAAPSPHPALVGGEAAFFLDQKESLARHLPFAVLVVVVATLLALFLMTGSVVLPLKAVVMNVLTLGATLGLLVLIFQDGRLEGLLAYTANGGLDLTQPILLGALAFGLSTDYAVFLLSRIKESHDAGATSAEAVAEGLQRTGRVVTAAALLFAVAVGAFASSRILLVKQLGAGTALAVLIDATVVRALLVPSLMALLGRHNWWAPGPLRRLHARVGLGERPAAGPG